MSSTELSPGLAELLQEVPVSGDLMKVTPEQVARGLRQGVEWARTRQTGLLPVERELLRRHREELAEVLLDACYVLLHDGEAGNKFAWTQTTSLSRAQSSSSRWLQEANRLPELRGVQAASDLLRFGSVTRLSHIAQRVVPSIRALFVQAVDCTHLRSQPKTAFQLYARIDELKPNARMASMAANNLAQLYEMEGSRRIGLDMVKERGRPEDLLTSINMFVYGADLGQEADFLQGLAYFADCATENPVAADEVIATRREVLAVGAWSPTPLARALARSAEPRFSGWQRKLLDVLL